jgi:hypothetical protein
MVKITVDKSFFYGIAALLAVVAVLGIGWLVTRGQSQEAAVPPAPLAAQPVAPGANVAPPPAGAAPIDIAPPAGAAPVDIAPAGAAPVSDGSLESVMAGGEITPEQDAAISRIAPNEALEKLGSEDVVWVDTRTTEEYAASHIPGALSIPAYTEDTRLSELPTDKEILLYCA